MLKICLLWDFVFILNLSKTKQVDFKTLFLLWEWHEASHQICWCWAEPGSPTGPALLRFLEGHGRRSCDQSAETQWSPRTSPQHPSSLPRLTIASLFACSWCTQTQRALRLYRKTLNVEQALMRATDIGSSSAHTEWSLSIHPSLISPPNPWLIYFNLSVGYKRDKGDKL